MQSSLSSFGPGRKPLRGDTQDSTAHPLGIETALGQKLSTFTMLDEAIGQPEVETGYHQARGREALEHGASGATL